jgi:cytochrome c-type biogenesis protein CcmH/NrfF
MIGARRTGIALAVLAVLVGAPTGALASGSPKAPDAAPKTTLPDVEDEVMCPICGTALNLSASPQADRERAYIRREIAAGKTKDQIKDDLVAQYGTQVLAEPPKSGFDLTAWLVPGAALLVALIGIAIGLARWRRAGRREAEVPPGDSGPPLDPSDAERLDADLARYDL